MPTRPPTVCRSQVEPGSTPVDSRSIPDRLPTAGRARVEPVSDPDRGSIRIGPGSIRIPIASISNRCRSRVAPGSSVDPWSARIDSSRSRVGPGSPADCELAIGRPRFDAGSTPDRSLAETAGPFPAHAGRPRIDPCGSLNNRCHRVDPGSIRWSIPDRPWSDPDRHADPVWSGVNRRLQVDPCSTRIDPDQQWVDPGSSVDCGASPGRCRPSRSPVDPG